MIKAQAFKVNLRKIFIAVSATCMFMNFSISFELFNLSLCLFRYVQCCWYGIMAWS